MSTWERRHHSVVLLIALQAFFLGAFGTLNEGVDPGWALIPAATLLGPALVDRSSRASQLLVASVSAAALAVQAVYAVLALGGEARGLVLMFMVVCVVALYEVAGVLIVTFVALALSMSVIAATNPALLDLPLGDPARAFETLFIAYLAIGVGSLALATMWRDHRSIRHIADQQRRATEAYLDVAGTLMFVMDRRGIVTVANRHTCLTLDREPDEVIGKEWFELALPQEYREEARRLYQMSYDAFRDTGEMFYEPFDYENEVECRDGSRRQVVWWATMISDRSGTPIGMVCSGTDVTDTRAAHAALERSGQEMDALRRLAQKVASLDDSRQAIVDAALALTGATAVIILEPDRERTHLEATTATRPEFCGGSLEIGREPTYAASAFLSGQPHFIADCTTAPGVNHQFVEAFGLRSGLHQPIVGGNGILGVLTVVWQEPVGSLHDRKAELVGLIAHEAAISLRRRESLAQLERAALVDPLTGVANRRAFDAELPLALRRAAQGNYPLGIVVLDLNEFKEVNDLFGHAAGDEVLIRAASAWAGVLRAGDLLARLGGDEFAVLLPSCDEIEMAHIVERLKRATPHEAGSSMGGAMWDGTEGASSLIRRADRAQYADKAAMKADERQSRAASDDAGHAAPTPEHHASPRVRPRAADPRADGLDARDAPGPDGDDGESAT